jgi:MHS family alpha-ketoglutarate permease-like MFS transporter
VPLLEALAQIRNAWVAFGLICVALTIVSGYTAIGAAVKAELFPTEVRALGVALPHALAASIFGGSAEYVGLWFKAAGSESSFFWYVSGCIALSLLVYLWMPETRHARIER